MEVLADMRVFLSNTWDARTSALQTKLLQPITIGNSPAIDDRLTVYRLAVHQTHTKVETNSH